MLSNERIIIIDWGQSLIFSSFVFLLFNLRPHKILRFSADLIGQKD